jgi:hypothetical protein
MQTTQAPKATPTHPATEDNSVIAGVTSTETPRVAPKPTPPKGKKTPANAPEVVKIAAAEAAATPEPTPAPEAKLPAKTILARKVVQAYADSTEGMDPVTRYTSALWIHHLPTGTDAQGRRWWPVGFPRPQRSDWSVKDHEPDAE